MHGHLRARLWLILIGLVVVTCADGCASKGERPGFGRRVGFYFKNRGADLLDVLDISAGVGPVGRISVQYGMGNWGLGWTETYRARFGGRSLLAKEQAQEIALLPPPLAQIVFLLHTYDMFIEGEAPLAWPFEGIADEDERAIFPLAVPWIHRSWTCFYCSQYLGDGVVGAPPVAIGAEIHALIGLRARIYPIEIADFLVGIFGFDLFDDDE